MLLSKAAEAQARLALGRFRVHALRAKLGSRHLKVRRELIVDIDIGPAISSTEEASEECAKRHSHFLLLRLEEAAHDSGDALPAFGCTDELPASARGDGVKASAAVVLRLAPVGANPAALFQSQQGWIDRPLIQREGVAAYLLDTPGEAVTMQRTH